MLMKDLSSGMLFARPSFTEGVARIVDFGTTLQDYNTSKTGNEADFRALKNDWMIVGQDLKYAIKKHEQNVAESK